MAGARWRQPRPAQWTRDAQLQGGCAGTSTSKHRQGPAGASLVELRNTIDIVLCQHSQSKIVFYSREHHGAKYIRMLET